MQNNDAVEKISTSNVLVKHLAAVHSSSSLTTMQRKAYNILLKNALKNIGEDRVHTISIKDLKEALGWSEKSNTNDDLKESLKGIGREQVEWNILEKDRKNKWTAATLLADVSIKDGNIFYSFALSLQSVLASPNIYAKLNMEVQKLLLNKYSVILWEVICGDLSVKNQDKAVSDWIQYGKILELLQLQGSCYEKRYALFRNQVIAIAVAEINGKSDMKVRVEEQIENRTIKALRFITERKESQTVITPGIEEHKLFVKMKEFGFLNRTIKGFLRDYSEEDLDTAIEFYEYIEKKQKHLIDSPVAYFKKTLAEGWVVPRLKNKNNANKNDAVQNIVYAVNEKEECIKIRELLIDSIGEPEYQSWFAPCRMTVEDKKLTIEVKSDFSRNYLNVHYSSNLNHVIKQCDSTLTGFSIISS